MRTTVTKMPPLIQASKEEVPVTVNVTGAVVPTAPADVRKTAVEKLFGRACLNKDGVPRATRIVCTIGPRCSSVETLTLMIEAGMDVARLNFSHIKSFDDAKSLVENLHQAMQAAGRDIAILADLPGPKIRLGDLAASVRIAAGDRVTLGGSTPTSIPCNPPDILHDLEVGNRIFIEDGKILLRMEERTTDGIRARVEIGGTLNARKGVNLPDTAIKDRIPTTQDIEKIAIIKALGITRLAASFVECGEDIDRVRAAFERCDAEPLYPSSNPVQIVAKIERSAAVERIEDIFSKSEGIMIARGDLAIEIGDALVPVVQKRLHDLCFQHGEPSGTATQMLATLQTADRPLRAEVNDVANSVMQGASFVMTSEETAIGHDPVGVVRWMDEIVRTTEHFAEHPELG